jgi:hypothetical protein
MMLCDSQEFARREWEEPPSAIREEQDPMITKSEELLRGLLDKLGRNPTGMLTDFDLFAMHSIVRESFSGDPAQEQDESRTQAGSSLRAASEVARDEESVLPQPKRRRENPHASILPSLPPGEGNGPRISQQADVGEGPHKNVDFRTVSSKALFCTAERRR